MGGLVYLVENSWDVLHIIKIILIKNGYNIFMDFNGELEAFDKIRPDVFLIDINLGAKNGLDICRKIKAKFGSIPVILMSANPFYKKAAYENLADAFLAKPFYSSQLLAILSRFVK
jgi:DNA-binding response OmpR family regulator